MDRILVEIYLPVVNQSYDVHIPLTSKIHKIEKLITNAFAELSDGSFAELQHPIICDRETGKPLDINMTALELGLQNGSKLMLI